jgi:hypothetical protein
VMTFTSHEKEDRSSQITSLAGPECGSKNHRSSFSVSFARCSVSITEMYAAVCIGSTWISHGKPHLHSLKRLTSLLFISTSRWSLRLLNRYHSQEHSAYRSISSTLTERAKPDGRDRCPSRYNGIGVSPTKANLERVAMGREHHHQLF